MDNPQEKFEAATKLLLNQLPSERSNQYNDAEWVLYDRYIPQVMSLVRNYKDSQSQRTPLKADMDFVRLLVNAAKSVSSHLM